MTPGAATVAALDRVARASSVIRARREAVVWHRNHGGVPADVVARLDAAADLLENAAAKLEALVK